MKILTRIVIISVALGTFQSNAFSSPSKPTTCEVVHSMVLAQSTWDPPYGVVNNFDMNVQVDTVDPYIPFEASVVFTMKNNFVESYWGNFQFLNKSYNKNIGDFTAKIWLSEMPFHLMGYIYNTNPLKVGDNPLTSISVNGVLCTMKT